MSLKGALFAIFGIAIASALIASAILAPIWLAPRLAPEVFSSQPPTTEVGNRLHLQIDVRKSIIDWLQVVFSAATAAGLVGTLFYTARNYRVASENLRITEYSKFSEAYFKSAELLGNANQDTVVGAIRAVGRLALSSYEEHRYVMNLLYDFVRRRSPYVVPPGGPPAIPPAISAEIQAVLDVIRFRKTSWERLADAPNLSGSSLAGMDLRNANLKYANLEDCDLRAINLSGADLTGAKLTRSLLNQAQLNETRLTRASLRNTDLDGARMISATLKRADLSGARGSVIGTNTWRARRQEHEPNLQWIDH